MLARLDRAKIVNTARRVVTCEAKGMVWLAESLDERFAMAVETILQASGRTVLTGLGKSGHIARKIAATLASTGTPAHYVHPVEASHGDLGMMAAGDVVLALSKSGETAELADLVGYTRRFGIPLIAITGEPRSTLAAEADVVLELPAAEEACRDGLVPTTSAAMALALGDALAIALMEHRHFTPDHFRTFHPGGSLGAQLVRVRDLMHAPVPLVAPDAAMGEAILEMSCKGFGVVGVGDRESGLRGIITDGDLRRHMSRLMERTAGEVMTPDPRTTGPDALARAALAEMTAAKITCLFVVDPPHSRRVIGLIHLHDCLRAGLG